MIPSWFLKIYVCCFILYLILTIWLQEGTNFTFNFGKNISLSEEIPEIDEPFLWHTPPVYEKYVTAQYYLCSGLGNQLFRFATYYGIGREIERSPFFLSNIKCSMKEIIDIFPNISKYAKVLNAPSKEMKYLKPLTDCRNYSIDPKIDQKFLIFKRNIPFEFCFFAKHRNEISQIMQFDEKLKRNITDFAKNMFGSDNSHKLCIHIRRGDFMDPKYQYAESRADFIEYAAPYIYNYLRNQSISNISLILMGQDEEFKHSLEINSTLFTQIYYPALSSRGHDLIFGSIFCDTFLISAARSTFAWWAAFLMSKEKNVFYNSKVLKKGKFEEYDKIFPPEWKKIDWD